jgi:hypothetical protein
MKRSDLKMLERAFALEIQGGLLQSRSRQAKRLAEDGYLESISWQDNAGPFRMTIEGYQLTHKGRMAYCETCK